MIQLERNLVYSEVEADPGYSSFALARSAHRVV